MRAPCTYMRASGRRRRLCAGAIIAQKPGMQIVGHNCIVRVCMCPCTLMCACVCFFVLLCVCLCLFVLACASLCFSVLVCVALLHFPRRSCVLCVLLCAFLCFCSFGVCRTGCFSLSRGSVHRQRQEKREREERETETERTV